MKKIERLRYFYDEGKEGEIFLDFVFECCVGGELSFELLVPN